MLITHSPLRLGKGVDPNARALLNEFKELTRDVVGNDNASFDTNRKAGGIEYENHRTDRFHSQSLSLKTTPSGEVDSMRLQNLDTHSQEAVEFEVESDGDLKTFTRSYSLGSVPGATTQATVNQATGVITDFSDDFRRTSNHHENAYFENEQLLWGDS